MGHYDEYRQEEADKAVAATRRIRDSQIASIDALIAALPSRSQASIKLKEARYWLEHPL